MNKKVEITTIMGIDTSCDDTSVAIVEGTKVLANIIASQEELHRKWGGVVPDIARRAHEENIDKVIAESFKRASKNAGKKYDWSKIDAIAVTYGPGLAIALEIGLNKAKQLAKEKGIPLIPVNHMEGHLLSSLAANSKGKAPVVLEDKSFPLLGILISGGHTEIILMKNFGDYEIVGETLDDAVGEAYDKVARMLGLGYPGGSVLTELAKKGDKEKYSLPVPLEKDGRLSFSYSGLKTAVFYMTKKMKEEQGELTRQQIFDIAASFEYSAIRHLRLKLRMAIKKYNPKIVLIGGGVTASPKVRAGIRQEAAKFELETHYPYTKKLFMDNGAMIAVTGYFKAKRGDFSNEEIDRDPRASIENNI